MAAWFMTQSPAGRLPRDRVPTDLENLENCWNFMLDLEYLA